MSPTVCNGTAGTSDGASPSAVCAAKRKVVHLKLYFFADSLTPRFTKPSGTLPGLSHSNQELFSSSCTEFALRTASKMIRYSRRQGATVALCAS